MTPQEFKALRHSTGLTQAKFGAMLGVQKAQISRIESGTREINETLLILCQAIKDGWRPR